MYTLFLSDLHLHAERPEKLQLFETLINRLDEQCQAVYILGDLFEFWHGDDDRTEEHQFVIKKLVSLSKKKIPVYVQKGNRDFLLGTVFSRDTGCEILPDPYTINLYGTETLIMHGDLLCTDDHDYQRFRKWMHTQWLQILYTALPLVIRRKIADKVRNKTIEESKSKSDDIMDVSQQTVDQYLKANQVMNMIHGHTHRPAHHQWQTRGNTANRYVLGDWYEQESVLFVTEESKELVTIADLFSRLDKQKLEVQ